MLITFILPHAAQIPVIRKASSQHSSRYLLSIQLALFLYLLHGYLSVLRGLQVFIKPHTEVIVRFLCLLCVFLKLSWSWRQLLPTHKKQVGIINDKIENLVRVFTDDGFFQRLVRNKLQLVIVLLQTRFCPVEVTVVRNLAVAIVASLFLCVEVWNMV